MVGLSHIGDSTHLIRRPTYPTRSTVRSTIHRCSSVVVQVSTVGRCRGDLPPAALGNPPGGGHAPPAVGLGARPHSNDNENKNALGLGATPHSNGNRMPLISHTLILMKSLRKNP